MTRLFVDRASSNELGKAICAMLHMDAQLVAAIDIRLAAGEVAEIRIRRYISQDELKQVADEIERYDLVPHRDVKEDAGQTPGGGDR